MKNIFLSVMTNVPEDYRAGYDNFLNLLKLQKLTPRTLGKTDFSHVNPLDEVVDLMYECEGVIVLGFPQIMIYEGDLCGLRLENPLQLAGEWNHIEGSIAYSIGLPVLVIHDSRISRGIFDKGVFNSFLYKKDLMDSSWSTSNEISGAIAKWQTKLKPIARPNTTNNNSEEPRIKWGCFTFPPDEKLYCPFCYNNKGEKYLTIRVDIRNRKCTSCQMNIPTG